MNKHLNKGRPEEGKIYALTGGHDQPSIANGNTWAESEVNLETCEICGKDFPTEHDDEIVAYLCNGCKN